MHRAFSRVFKGTCRNWRENKCPVASGDNVNRNNNNDKSHEFVPPKHTWNECLGWTTGLVLAWQLTHRKCTSLLVGDETTKENHSSNATLKKCPFELTAKVFSQPVVSTVSNVAGRKHNTQRSSLGIKKSSIDATPFIQENFALFDATIPFTKPSDDDTYDVVFEEEPRTAITLQKLKSSIPLQTKAVDDEPVPVNTDTFIKKFSADLYNVLGAFKFLRNDVAENTPSGCPLPSSPISTTDHPIHALDLLHKGAEFGSARALYNIGVAYDRMQETELAQDYYRRASDLGHPLATYNTSIFSLREGKIAEGLTLMRVAAEKGVPEAKRVLNDNDM